MYDVSLLMAILHDKSNECLTCTLNIDFSCRINAFPLCGSRIQGACIIKKVDPFKFELAITYWNAVYF